MVVLKRYLRTLALSGSLAFIFLDLFIHSTVLQAQERLLTNPINNELGVVTAIESDRHGFTWIATHTGIYRYNGKDYVYTNDLAPQIELPHGFVNCMLADSHDNLWIFYRYEGLYRINTSTFELVHYPDFLGTQRGDFYLQAYEAPDSTIYLPYSGGMARYFPQGDSIKFLQPQWQYEGQQLALICGRKDGLLIVGDSKAQIGIYNPVTDSISPLDLPSHGTGILNAINFDQKGFLWISTWYNDEFGLIRYDVDRREVDRVFGKYRSDVDFIKSADIWKIVPTETGVYFPTNAGGMWYYDLTKESMNEVLMKDTYSKFVSYPQLRSLHLDDFGRLWAGGSVKIHRDEPYDKHIEILHSNPHKKNSLRSDRTRTLKILSNGELAIGTIEGLSIYNPHRDDFINIDFPEYIGNSYNNQINSIAEYPKGQLWVGTWSGLSSINLKTYQQEEYFITYTNAGNDHPKDVFKPEVGAPTELLPDEKNNLWIISNRSEIWKMTDVNDRKAFVNYNLNTSRGDKISFSEIVFDNSMGLFVGSDNGLWNYDYITDMWNIVHLTHGLTDSSKVSDVYISDQHKMYLIVDNELYLISKIEIDNYEARKLEINKKYRELSNPVIDREGDLWLLHKEGIVRINLEREELVDFGNNEHLYGSSMDRSFKLSKVDIDRSGVIYTSTNDGVIIINPSQLEFNTIPPDIILNSIKINGEEYDLFPAHNISKIDLEHDQNNITISFGSINDQYPSEVTYEYRMGSQEDAWLSLDQESSVYLMGLSPGTYEWQLRAQSSDGTASEEVKSVLIKINAPWYLTSLAFLLYGLLILGIGYIIYRFKIGELLAKEKSEQLSELDSFKTRFITNLTHELKTPLTIITGMAQRIISDPKKWAKEGAGLIERNGNHLDHLINQMLDLSRIDEGMLHLETQHDDVIYYIRYLTNSFNTLAEDRNQNLCFISDQEEWSIDFDPDKIQIIVTNLISNAIKYTPSGGTIEVLVTQDKNNEYLCIEVKDNGPGIDKNDQVHLFKRYFRVEDKNKDKEDVNISTGTGIGLAMTKEIVEFIGGSIAVESELGAGATFKVSLPISHVTSKNEIVQEHVVNTDRLSQETPSEKIQVLIVEDNNEIRSYLSSLLGATYEIITAVNGRIGYEIAIDEIPDLIVSDVMMPEMSGFEMLEALKKDGHTDHIPVILLTARGGVDSRISGISHGADAYISKPFKEEEVLVQIQQLLTTRASLKQKYSSKKIADFMSKHNDDVQHNYISKLIDICKEHIHNPQFNAEILAKKVFVSSRQLSRKLKAISDLTPSQLIRKVRVDQAQLLLHKEDITIGQVAIETGFLNPQYMATVFKKELGISPSQVHEKVI